MTISRLAFAFAGQGAQFAQMGLDLFENSAAARNIFQQADDILGRKISALCFTAPLEDLTACANCQPAIFTMSLACHAALQELCPVQPTACAGLSLGELSAMVAAGACSFADGLRLVQARGQLMDLACQENPGAMLAILGATTEQAAQLAAEFDVDLANLNCPGQIIASGATEKIAALQASPQAASFKTVRLNVAGAYHSRLMSRAAEQFAEAIAQVPLQTPHCSFAQNFTGTFSESPEDIRQNLVAQISHTVRCEDCLRLLSANADLIIELGPGNVLCGLLKRIDRRFPTSSISSYETLKRTVETING